MQHTQKAGTKCSKVKILLHKKRFDIGYGETSFIKLVLALFGITTLDLKLTMSLAVFYAVFCYIFGWGFIKYGWLQAQIEINNLNNLFVKQMRKKERFK